MVVRGKGVGLDDIRAGLEIGEVDFADGVGLGQDQQIVVAAQIARPVGESRRRENRSSENLRCWIIVPMAPSSTRSFPARRR